jgi:hypothetical protein
VRTRERCLELAALIDRKRASGRTYLKADEALAIQDALWDAHLELEARAEAGVTEAIKKVEIVVGPGQVFYRLVDGVLTVWAGNGLEFADEDVMRVRIGPDHTKWAMTSTLSQGN